METVIGECPLGAKCEEVKLRAGRQILVRCPWYTKVVGTDSNTGEHVDRFACAIAWIPTLLIQNANEVRQGAAATESFRNAMVEKQTEFNALVGNAAQALR